MVKIPVNGAIALVLAVGLAAGLGGCNTMEGFGKDMSAAGRALSNSAERTKNSSASAANSSGATDATSSTATNTPSYGSAADTTGTGGTGSTAVTPVTPTPLK